MKENEMKIYWVKLKYKGSSLTPSWSLTDERFPNEEAVRKAYAKLAKRDDFELLGVQPHKPLVIPSDD